MLQQLRLETRAHREFVNVTGQVAEQVRASGVAEGLCLAYARGASLDGVDGGVGVAGRAT